MFMSAVEHLETTPHLRGMQKIELSSSHWAHVVNSF